MIHQRRTLRRPVTFTGAGLHSGHPVKAVIHPSDNGIAFRCNGSRVVATPSAVTDSRWRTTLGEISTVEHLVSAFAGVGITDAEVELSYPELPALCGSADSFVAALRTQPLSPAEVLLPRNEVVVDSITVRPGTGRWSYTFAHGSTTQTFTCQLPRDYRTQVAPARTFTLVDQVPDLLSQGLGQGLDLSSVLLLGTDDYSTTPRFPDEPARHKLLDLIGDLYLTGIPPGLLDVTATGTGHTTNIRMATALTSEPRPGARRA